MIAAAALASACACGSSSGGTAHDAPGPVAHDGSATAVSRAGGAVIERDELLARLRAVRFVLLGEVHDNPHHHRIQAELVAKLARVVPPPAVVFEMLDPERQDAIDAFRGEGGRDPDAFAARVAWSESGWPDFALYRPLFEVVLDAGLPIVAAGLPRGRSLAPDAPERSAGFGLDEPLPPRQQAERLDEMFAAHCGLLPREHLASMVELQRARDARLALALLRAASDHGRAVLVAGNGHVRDDDTPALLERAGVARVAIANVGLLEPGSDDDDRASRFDFRFVTPAAERDDPCESLRERFATPAPGPDA